jgi:hypothetical protein
LHLLANDVHRLLDLFSATTNLDTLMPVYQRRIFLNLDVAVRIGLQSTHVLPTTAEDRACGVSS